MNKIKELRTEKGYTQADLARLLGVNQTAVGKYERGELEPNIQILMKLSQIFEVTVDYIIGNSDDLGVISINSAPNFEPSPRAKEMLSLFEGLPQEYQAQILEYTRYFVERIGNRGGNRRT